MKVKFLTVLSLVLILAALGVTVLGASPSNQRQVFRDLWAQKLTVFGNSGIDMIGNIIDLDADNDTSITADTDDQIDIEIGGGDEYILTDSIIDINANQLDLDADNDTSITVDTDDQLDLEIGGTDEISVTASTLFLNDTLIDQAEDTENIGLPTIVSTAITYTAAAGGSGTVATIGAGEVWFVHAVYVNVTTDFDTTGDDATLVIGDGGDANGLIDLADAELQAADTEGTGAAAGWQGIMSTDTVGAYLAEGLGFVYSGSETIDYLIDETSGETLTAGAATIYVVYTRLQ